MAVLNYPNSNFVWYNDDDRLAILCIDSSNSTGETTKEKYDTFQNDGVDITAGLRITYHSKYEELSSISHDLKINGGLDSALHTAALCYVKSRLFEDAGDLQKAQYFRQMYEVKVKKHRGRKSGVRNLSVTRL